MVKTNTADKQLSTGGKNVNKLRPKCFAHCFSDSTVCGIFGTELCPDPVNADRELHEWLKC